MSTITPVVSAQGTRTQQLLGTPAEPPTRIYTQIRIKLLIASITNNLEYRGTVVATQVKTDHLALPSAAAPICMMLPVRQYAPLSITVVVPIQIVKHFIVGQQSRFGDKLVGI